MNSNNDKIRSEVHTDVPDRGHPVDSVVSIGNFDGVHVGHQKILADARQLAQQSGAIVAAVTLDPHPIAVFAPEKAPAMIMTPQQKTLALRKAGADIVITIETTKQLLGLSAEDFLKFIGDKIHPVGFVEGDDFCFGRNRQGDAALLRKMGTELGFKVKISEPVMMELPDGRNLRVSSSEIRQLILAGDMESAGKCMSRAFTLCGMVVTGRGDGRKLGFPTANLDCGSQIIPADGIYAATACLPGGVKFPAAVFIGPCVTYGQSDRVVETHIPLKVLPAGTKLDLYNQGISLEFVQRLRSSEKFETLDELKKAIENDIERTLQIVG